MRFLGIEFRGIAGYSKQFISLGSAVNLIAGRNNIGKTAMLSASTVLQYLPVGEAPHGPVPSTIREYANSDGSFEFSLFFIANLLEAPNIDMNQAKWEQNLTSQEIRFTYNFHIQRQGYI